MDIQVILVLLLFAGAAFYLGRKLFGKSSGQGSQGGCDNCTPAEKGSQKTIRKTEDAKKKFFL